MDDAPRLSWFNHAVLSSVRNISQEREDVLFFLFLETALQFFGRITVNFSEKDANSTQCSQPVSHPSINRSVSSVRFPFFRHFTTFARLPDGALL